MLAVVSLALSPKALLSQSSPEASVAGLRFRMDRSGDERYLAIQRALKDGHAAEVLNGLERLREDTLVPTPDGAVAGIVLADRILQASPGSLQTILQREIGLRAQQAWHEWQRAPDSETLQEFCHRYGSTTVGVNAWCQLGARFMDDLRWQQAHAVWQIVLAHPLATQPQKDLARRCASACTEVISRQSPLDVREIPAQNEGQSNPLAASRPGMISTGEWPLSPPSALHEAWTNWQQQFHLQGAVTWTAGQPRTSGPVLLIRDCRGLSALDRDSFKPRWQIPLESWDWLENNPGYLDNSGFRQTFMEQFGRKQISDHLTQNVVADNQRVYLVVPRKDRLDSAATMGPFPGNVPRDVVKDPFNYLVAYDLQTGQLAWRIGGESAGPTYPFGEVFFCSLPTIVDDMAFVIGQQQTELLLFAVHAVRGDLLWKLHLGDTPRALSADPARHRINCQPVFRDGLLYCPTASGALIAVNPLARSIEWAYRYDIFAHENPATSRNENTSFLRDVWWQGWRTPQIHIRDHIGILCTPESDQLLAFQARTGEQIWEMPRDQGLLSLASATSPLIIQEKDALRAHDWQSGQVLWRTPCDLFSGQGAIIGERIIVPLIEGATQTVRTIDGRAENVDWPGRALGHLQFTGREWLATSLDRLTRWTDLQSQDSVASSPDVPPSKEEQAWDSARIAFSQGDMQRAQAELAHLPPDDATTLRRLIAREELRVSGVNPLVMPTNLLRTSSAEVQAVEDRIIAALQFDHQGQRRQAAELLMSALTTAPRQGAIRLAGPERFIRPDLAVIGLLSDIWERDGRETGDVHQVFQQAWQSAQKSSNPFALPMLTELCQPMRWTDHLVTEAGDVAFLGQSLRARELRLLCAVNRQSSDANIPIVRRLVDQLRQAGFAQDADDYLRGIQTQRGPAAVSPWPDRVPELERKREQNYNVHFFPVPLDLASTVFFDRLDVSVERLGQRVRLAGAGHPGTWEVHLPPLPYSFRYLQQHVAGWGRGRVLVLRVGFELFGLAPVDDRGDPAAQILWHLDTLSGSPLNPDQLRLEIVPAIPGIREEDYRVIDTFGRTVAQVGPVCADYLCYMDKGQLVSIDLLTGLRRWSRADITPRTVITGNSDYIFLCHPDQRTIECLRASDGATIDVKPCHLDFERILRLDHGFAWSLSAQNPPALVCDSLKTLQPIWKKSLPAAAGVTALDDHHWGCVAPDGQLSILDGRDGTTITQVPLQHVPAQIDRVLSARDGDFWFVMLSSRVPQQAGLQQSQLRGGYRAPFMTGTLATIDRNSQHLQWQRQLEREPFAMDQPRSVPVLMQNYKIPPPDLQSGQVTDGVIRLINKYSGEMLLDERSPELMGYAALSADAPRGLINLALEREVLQFWYSPRPPAPALPDVE